jgi:hypothetical protein
MPLTLTIADAGDGTGGAATIAGSAGAANVVYYAPWNGQQTPLGWTVGGSRIGDGAVPLALPVGYYLFQLLSAGMVGPAPVVKLNFTNGIPAVHYRGLIGTQARVNDVALVGMDSTKIKVQWLPRAVDVDLAMLPLIAICPPGFEVNVSEVLSQDDFLYPIVVAILVSQKGDSVAHLPDVLKWREQINRSLCYQRLPGITEMMWMEPKLMNIVDPDSYVNKSILLSVLGYGMRIRQTRGLT